MLGLFRKIFGGYFDGCWEVTGFTECKNTACSNKEPYAGRCDSESCCGSRLHGRHELYGFITLNMHGQPAAKSVRTSAEAPYTDSPKVSFLGSHPIYEFSGKEHTDGIDDGECGGNCTVIVIGPVKFGRDKIFPCKRQHLTVHVIDGSCDEKQYAHPPSPDRYRRRRKPEPPPIHSA